MSTITLLSTYLMLYSVTASTKTEEPTTTIISEDTTYNLFTIQWKPQMCFKNTHPNCHNVAIPNITIHGIWPNYYNGGWPSDCTNNKLQYENIQHLQTELNIYWPTLFSKDTAFEFWSSEWSKHGTCWYLVNATQYFEYALQWIKNDYNNIQDILSASDIYPSNEQTYPLKQITESLSAGLNQKIFVRCSAGKYISEFFVCRDWFGNKIDCPDLLKSNCAETVVLTVQVLPDTTTTTTTNPSTTVATSTSIAIELVSTSSVSEESDESISEDSISESNEDVIIAEKHDDTKPLKVFYEHGHVHAWLVILIIIMVLFFVSTCGTLIYFCLARKDRGGLSHHQRIKTETMDLSDDECIIEMINSTLRN